MTDKVHEARLRLPPWSQSWTWRTATRRWLDCVKRILEAEIYGQRSRGRQKKRWTQLGGVV